MPNPTAFFSSSVAQEIAATVYAQTRILRSVILAQMAVETGFGTSNLWLNCHNPAGINGSGTGGCAGFASYPTYTAAAQGYAATYENGLYSGVLAAAQAGDSAETIAVAVGESPWAASHYRGVCGADGCQLVAMIQQWNLTQYDGTTIKTTTPTTSVPLFSTPRSEAILYGVGAALLLGGMGTIVLSRHPGTRTRWESEAESWAHRV